MEETNTTTVVIILKSLKIIGAIDLIPGSRLTDYIDEVDTFFAVTDAQVTDRNTGETILKAKFINVNKANIEIILPAEMIA